MEAAFVHVIAGAQYQRGISARLQSFLSRVQVAGKRLAVKADEVLCERLGLREHPPIGPQRETRSVKHEAVVSANLVHQRNRNAVVPGNGGQHVKSQFAFVKIKRRRRDVQQDLSTRADQVLHGIDSVQLTVPEILVVPRVFANRERKLLAVKGQQLLAIGGREVAHLVKHVVAGQQAFRLDGGDLSLTQQRP